MNEQPPFGIPAEDWAVTPASVRTVLVALLPLVERIPLLEARIAALEAENAALKAENADLRARLNLNSGNSSKPPSSDPPSAPTRPSKTPRGRQRGGQPGHEGHYRPLLPPEQVDHIIPVSPPQCAFCQHPLDPDLPDVRDPIRHQSYDIPPIKPIITEHQLRALSCPHCGEMTRAEPPPDMPPMGYSARTVAIAALIHARAKQSDRDTAALMKQIFHVPMADGSVTATEQVMRAALDPPYEEVQTAMPTQTRANLDETPWKQGTAGKAGKRKGWLWVAVTQLCTLFLVWRKRDAAALDALLGRAWRGIITSDRWSVYKQFLVEQRQLCWAHLIRDITRFFDYARDGPVHDWGATGLAQIHLLFVLWHSYRAGDLDRRQLQDGMADLQTAFHLWLERGKDVPYEKARSFSRDIMSLEAALWTFVREEGVEPTNNAAERALRPAVIWRKLCYGSQSEAGSRYVERMLTVMATCKQHDRDLLSFLTEAVQAYWTKTPPPRLIQPT